ncbi:DUF5996 family protein [Arenibaculum sp.]|jgi:hypothetical protein|uniref:DUF5996 family protein n=1 Tax=Arenibaculum sp. TaxID=2865862 RepID=UPI002E11E027|nr:DUF5996 family protein [Arenibaculum sp.]
MEPNAQTRIWPPLVPAQWEETRRALHMWTQVIGKVRLALAPLENHWWQVPLYVDCRELTTSPMPHDGRTVQIDLDLVGHRLAIRCSDGTERGFALGPASVAGFHARLTAELAALGIEAPIWPVPVEVPDPVPFERDREIVAYDADAAQRFWRVLVQADRVLKRFRAGFLGKASPVHFFWGSFDLAATRFSGRPAPRHPGAPGVADAVTREAYSHEVSSAGFWPGGGGVDTALFYAYAYPEPPGFAQAAVQPAEARYDETLREFVLPYDAVRLAPDPDRALLSFLQSTYEAAADLGGWDRAALERAA